MNELNNLYASLALFFGRTSPVQILGLVLVALAILGSIVTVILTVATMAANKKKEDSWTSLGKDRQFGEMEVREKRASLQEIQSYRK